MRLTSRFKFAQDGRATASRCLQEAKPVSAGSPEFRRLGRLIRRYGESRFLVKAIS
jgi:hypothetical protein